MRQNIGTIIICLSLMILFIESCIDLTGIVKCLPLIRAGILFFTVIYVLYHGEMNHREYEAKAKKIKELRIQEQKAKWLEEYEEFRREKHAN